MRLFLAAELPVAARDTLARWARGALGRGGVPRCLDADSLHLTLCFLGEQPPSAPAEIATVLRSSVELIAAVEELALGAPVWLPPRRPRALAIEVGDASGGLRVLRGALAGELAGVLGWHAGRERFRPHVTVARMRAGTQCPRELPPTPPLRFAPAAVTLFRSSLDPGGARYEPLASVSP